jgi:hypothetical protein
LCHGVLGLDLVPDLWLDIISSNMDRLIIIAVNISDPYILSKIHVCKILAWSPASKGLEISEWIVDIGFIFRTEILVGLGVRICIVVFIIRICIEVFRVAIELGIGPKGIDV